MSAEFSCDICKQNFKLLNPGPSYLEKVYAVVCKSCCQHFVDTKMVDSATQPKDPCAWDLETETVDNFLNRLGSNQQKILKLIYFDEYDLTESLICTVTNSNKFYNIKTVMISNMVFSKVHYGRLGTKGLVKYRYDPNFQTILLEKLNRRYIKILLDT